MANEKYGQKYGQCNMRNIFFKKSYIKCGGETSARPNCRLLAFTSYKAFLKNKKRSRTSVCISFSALLFEEKHFSCYILLTGQISLPGCLCIVRYWVIYVL